MLVLYLQRRIQVIYPPVHGAKRLAFLFIFLIEFCSVSLLHSGQIGLHCNTVCAKNTVTSSLFNNAFPDAEICGFLFLIQITRYIQVLRIVKIVLK